MRIGDRIKNRRIELGMTVDDLAKKLKINRATIYRYESNDIEKLPVTVLEPLAIALKTTPWELTGWGDTGKQIKHDIPDELKELGIEWVMVTRKAKDSGLTPEELDSFIDAIKKIKK